MLAHANLLDRSNITVNDRIIKPLFHLAMPYELIKNRPRKQILLSDNSSYIFSSISILQAIQERYRQKKKKNHAKTTWAGYDP